MASARRIAWTGIGGLVLLVALVGYRVATRPAEPPLPIPANVEQWVEGERYSAPEATQAAAADDRYVYAIANKVVARYDRATGKRLGLSTGDASHLNSGVVEGAKMYCAHS